MKNKSLTIRLRLWTGMSNYYSLSVPGRHASIPYFGANVKAILHFSEKTFGIFDMGPHEQEILIIREVH